MFNFILNWFKNWRLCCNCQHKSLSTKHSFWQCAWCSSYNNWEKKGDK